MTRVGAHDSHRFGARYASLFGLDFGTRQRGGAHSRQTYGPGPPV
jgi:hypothetical protein